MKKSELKRLKNMLPKGYSRRLAERCDCSASTVRMVITGNRKDYYNIIAEAILMAEQNKICQENNSKKLKELVS
jgi:hypothetical protein